MSSPAIIPVDKTTQQYYPVKDKEYYVVTYDPTTQDQNSNPVKRKFLSKTETDLGNNDTVYKYNFDDNGMPDSRIYFNGPNGKCGNTVSLYEIPAGGKRRNNRRKSAKNSGRSRRMRRMRRSNNRKSSRRF